jgi:hypothetical protein
MLVSGRPSTVLCVWRVVRNNLRIMRKTLALDPLFPTVRGEVLAATLTQPDKWWYLSELAQVHRNDSFEPTAATESPRRWWHSRKAP